MNQRGSKGAQACQTNQVFREGSKTLAWINRVWREDWIWGNSLEYAIAGDHRAIRFSNKRARTGRMTRRVNNAQRSRFKLQFLLVEKFTVLIGLERVGI